MVSINRVRGEVLAGNIPENVAENLRTWAALSDSFFQPTDPPEVNDVFKQIMRWVIGHGQFKDDAKAEFADKADGWLAAYAKVYGHTVVTQEAYTPDAQRCISLPNVCRQFHVPCVSTFEMLRELKASFGWQPP